MNRAIEFIQNFLAQEYDTSIVGYTERDESVYSAAVRSLSRYCLPGLASVFIGRPLTPEEDWYKDDTTARADIQKRKLFQIKHYRHPQYQDLYRCYVSTTDPGDDTYASCLYLTQIENELKIVAKYNLDYGTGKWVNRGGTKIYKLCKPLEVKKFFPPSRSADRAEYDSE